MRSSYPMLPLLAALALPLVPSMALAQSDACAPGAPADPALAQPITTPPPPLPDYEQPPIPAEGYLWTPGYWSYGTSGYYWVPGTWVQPPSAGLLWTPGYWGWFNGAYIFSAGYWGPHVGFYGGVNYGFGYGGVGYQGGSWYHNVFSYNHTVNNFGNVHITNVYNKTIINNTTINRISYNGGNGGIAARPSAADEAVFRDHRDPPTASQTQHFTAARNDPALRASVNQGHPAVAATARPGEFKEGAIPAHGAPAAVEGHPASATPERPPAAAEHPAAAIEQHSSAGPGDHPPPVPEHDSAVSGGHPPPVFQHEPAAAHEADVRHEVTPVRPEAPASQPHMAAAPRAEPPHPVPSRPEGRPEGRPEAHPAPHPEEKRAP
jgi:WXXGXW repeat (2 copies)